jgi:hydroxymethylbilane synthase
VNAAVALPDRVVIASRASVLAMWQSEYVQAHLRKLYPQCAVDILSMSTRGDEILDRSLAKIGGKGLFVKELENALLSGAAHIAVHSMKDVPMVLPDGYVIGAITERDDPRDALVSSRYHGLAEIPAGACIGTSSLRREAQLRQRRPDLVVRPLRGNVQSRLRKLDAGEYDAVILAAAGLRRLGLGARIASLLPVEDSLPAPGQGALGIECLAERADLVQALTPLQDASTALAVRAERALSRALGGSCQVPLGAYATLESDRLWLRGFIATADGRTCLRAAAEGPADAPERLGDTVAAKLREQGADAIIEALDVAP